MLNRALVLLFCLSLPSLAPLSSLAQQSAAPLQNGTDRRIVLDVVVTDKSGKPVAGLQKQDFTVLDNKQPGQVVSFEAESEAALTPDSPVEVVLVIDEVNVPYMKNENVREEIGKFLKQNDGKLAQPVSLAFFTNAGSQIQVTPALDGNALMAALDQHKNELHSMKEGQDSMGPRTACSRH